MKGISREVVPYAVEGLLGELPQRAQVISEHGKGLDLFIDLDVIDDHAAERTQAAAAGAAGGAGEAGEAGVGRLIRLG